MMFIQDTSTEHSSIAVRSVIHRQSVGQIIDERELGSVGFIVTSDQHVHLVGVARSQVVSQVLASEVSRCFRAQLVTVSHFVEQDVFGNVLDELNCIAGIANGSDQQ